MTDFYEASSGFEKSMLPGDFEKITWQHGLFKT
jgi:hypothetical protein